MSNSREPLPNKLQEVVQVGAVAMVMAEGTIIMEGLVEETRSRLISSPIQRVRWQPMITSRN